MRPLALIAGMLLALAGPCEKVRPGGADAAPRLIAAGNLNNLYVVVAARIEGEEGFEFWQRDARGMWRDVGAGQGPAVAAAAWREDLLVFFESGRLGRFGLAAPVIFPSPMPAWTPVAACADGLAADAFGWNAAGEPVHVRYENDQWTWRPVEAAMERDKAVGIQAARVGGRLYLVWREEVPTLTGSAPTYRIRFVYLDKDQWRGPMTSRLQVGSTPHVASNGEAMVCLFRRPGQDGQPGPWAVAAYATADEDWHETGLVTGTMPEEPLALGRSGGETFVVALGPKGPVVAPLDLAEARVDAFAPLVLERKAAQEGGTGYSSILFFGLTVAAFLLLLASVRRAGRAAVKAGVPTTPPSGFVYAPLGRRAGAIVIDYLLVSMLEAFLYPYLSPDLWDLLREGKITSFESLPMHEIMMLHVWFMGGVIVYCTVAEVLFGGTVGKRLLGLEVRTEGGERIAWWQGAVRNALRLVDYLPFGLYLVGLLLILVGPKPQRFGDRVSRTVVVRVAPAARAEPWRP